MAEPNISIELNTGSEATPSWASIDTAMRWTGPAGVGDPFPAGVTDSDDAFFDNGSSPNDGELWHDTTTDAQITVAGRNTNQNVIRANETGASDGTSDPPELTYYDDATDAGNRTAPTNSILTGTSGSCNNSFMRGIETDSGAPGTGWTGQTHDSAPSGNGSLLEGDESVEPANAALGAGGAVKWNIAACAAHDAPAGISNLVVAVQYTFT